jgi:hypothetical protein
MKLDLTPKTVAARTYAGIELLKLQVKIALQRALQPGDLSPSDLDSVAKGLQNEWIERVRIVGVDEGGDIRCELVLHIDWRIREVRFSVGLTAAEADNRRSDDISSSDLDNYVETFHDHVSNNGLRTKWSIAYRAHLDADAVNRTLGLANHLEA